MASDKPRTLRAYMVDDEPLALRSLLRMLEQSVNLERCCLPVGPARERISESLLCL